MQVNTLLRKESICYMNFCIEDGKCSLILKIKATSHILIGVWDFFGDNVVCKVILLGY